MRIVDPFGGEEAGDLGGDVLVLPSGDVRPALEDRHGAAEAAEHLAELEGDVAAADDDEVLGQRVEVEDAIVVEPGHVTESRDRGLCGPRAHVEEDLGRHHRALSDGDHVAVGFAADEARLAVDEGEPLHVRQGARCSLDPAVDQAVLARHRRAEVDTNHAGRHAVGAGGAGQMGHPRRCPQGLRRTATAVEAGSPDLVLLDEGHPRAA